MGAKYFVIWSTPRSGASLLSAAMRVFGAEVSRGVLDGYAPKENSENFKLVELNEAMLAEIGQKWHNLSAIGAEQWAILERAGYVDRAADFLEREAGLAPVVLLKDPRMSRLGAIWRQAFSRLGVIPYSVVTWRDPLAVANSLRLRAQNVKYPSPLNDIKYGLFIWLAGTQSAIKFSDGYRRILVNYDSFLEAPQHWLEKMAAVFGLPVDAGRLEIFYRHSVHPELNHNAEPLEVIPLPESVKQLQLRLQESGEVCPPVEHIWPVSMEEQMLASMLDDSNRHLRAYAGKMASIHAEICVLTGECKRMALELQSIRGNQARM